MGQRRKLGAEGGGGGGGWLGEACTKKRREKRGVGLAWCVCVQVRGERGHYVTKTSLNGQIVRRGKQQRKKKKNK